MGLFKRAGEIFESKLNKLLDQIEDPNATLDLSYDKMLDGLQEVKRHLADVVTQQKQLELQTSKVTVEIAERDKEAKAAVQLGRDDLASAAIERKLKATQQLQELTQAVDKVQAQADRLKAAEHSYQERLDAFKTQKEVTKATYEAAKAQVRMGESMSGISRELGNVGETLRRANEKAEAMSARASAMDELHDEGYLPDALDSRDSVTRELHDVKRQSDVAAELARLKQSLEEK